MEQHRLRRIPIAEAKPADIWLRVTGDSEWIHLDTLFGRRAISRAVWTPKLLRWGGLAATIGGLLWIALIIIPHLVYALRMQLDYRRFDQETWTFVSAILLYLDLDPDFLVIPLLLFLVGAVGLYVKQWRTSSLFAFCLAAVGIVLTIMDTLFPGWLYVVHRYFAYGYTNFFGGSWCSPPSPIWDWLRGTYFGIGVMSLGLALSGLVVLRARALPTKSTVFFIFTALGLLLVSLFVATLPSALFGLINCAFGNNDFLYSFDSFTIVMVLFGVSWIWLGYRLIAQNAKASSQPFPAGMGR